MPPPTRIAVIGSGPAGFYAAGHLLADSGGLIEVDMFERLPTPWGLVRSGVAPDHPKIKSVTRIYEKTAAHPRFRYFGNVEFGARHLARRARSALPRDRLRDRLARPTGRWASPAKTFPASTPPPTSSAGTTATPTTPTSSFDLSAERAVVIGNGNVALDVARMLDALAR